MNGVELEEVENGDGKRDRATPLSGHFAVFYLGPTMPRQGLAVPRMQPKP